MKQKILSIQQPVAGLTLSDGSIWSILAGDERAFSVVSFLGNVMQLSLTPRPSTLIDGCCAESSFLGSVKYLHVLLETSESEQLFNKNNRSKASTPAKYSSWHVENEKKITCILKPAKNSDEFLIQLFLFSFFIVQESQNLGGILLHGALAEKDEYGVVLAGPEQVGKTTASRRLPSPWRSLCDDKTLVVRDKQGTYWGHPWPTWSNFISDGPGGTWDVQHAVKLKGIFFLEQSQEELFNPLSIIQSICLLNESAEQASFSITYQMEKNELCEFRLKRFDNTCTLAQAVPCFHLRLSRHGKFWIEIEQALKNRRL